MGERVVQRTQLPSSPQHSHRRCCCAGLGLRPFRWRSAGCGLPRRAGSCFRRGPPGRRRRRWCRTVVDAPICARPVLRAEGVSCALARRARRAGAVCEFRRHRRANGSPLARTLRTCGSCSAMRCRSAFSRGTGRGSRDAFLRRTLGLLEARSAAERRGCRNKCPVRTVASAFWRLRRFGAISATLVAGSSRSDSRGSAAGIGPPRCVDPALALCRRRATLSEHAQGSPNGVGGFASSKNTRVSARDWATCACHASRAHRGASFR